MIDFGNQIVIGFWYLMIVSHVITTDTTNLVGWSKQDKLLKDGAHLSTNKQKKFSNLPIQFVFWFNDKEQLLQTDTIS